MKIRNSLLALLCISFYSASAQSDEINISAAFSSSIDLRIASGANINFTFSTLEEYQNGKSGASTFEVASSVNFSVAMSYTPFTNADGDEIDLRNLTIRLRVPEARSSEVGVRWSYPIGTVLTNELAKDGLYYSGTYLATTAPQTVLLPGPSGNAGTYEDNQFEIVFHMGYQGRNDALSGIGLPSLLDQNIAPGTYTCTVTLEAIPEAL